MSALKWSIYAVSLVGAAIHTFRSVRDNHSKLVSMRWYTSEVRVALLAAYNSYSCICAERIFTMYTTHPSKAGLHSSVIRAIRRQMPQQAIPGVGVTPLVVDYRIMTPQRYKAFKQNYYYGAPFTAEWPDNVKEYIRSATDKFNRLPRILSV